MDPAATPAIDRVLHLLIFLSAGACIAMAGVLVLDRLGSDRRSPPVVRVRHLLVPVVALVASGAAERLYHAVA